jgi:hypothetical protein
MTPTLRIQIAQLVADIEQSRCSLGVNGALLQQLGRVVFENWQSIDQEGKRLRSVETRRAPHGARPRPPAPRAAAHALHHAVGRSGRAPPRAATDRRQEGREPMIDLPRLAISVRQPWAWAIIHGGKPLENRTAGAIKFMVPLTRPPRRSTPARA